MIYKHHFASVRHPFHPHNALGLANLREAVGLYLEECPIQPDRALGHRPH